MKYTGTVTEVEFSLDEYNFDVLGAVVSEDQIAIDWDENGETYHVGLHAGCLLLFGAELLMGGGGWVNYQAAGVANVGQV